MLHKAFDLDNKHKVWKLKYYEMYKWRGELVASEMVCAPWS